MQHILEVYQKTTFYILFVRLSLKYQHCMYVAWFSVVDPYYITLSVNFGRFKKEELTKD